MKYLMILVLSGTLLFCYSCEEKREASTPAITTVVYEAGQEGYSHYRIPSLLKNDRYLFAFAEARKNSVSDHGDISIVLRRSSDLGKTWGPLIRVVEVAGESMQNPAPVYVEEENKLVLLFTKRTVGADTEKMIREGSSKGYVGVYAMESFDEGESWSEIAEITSSVKRDNWRWYALGPGGIIQLKYHAEHKGRIIIPANHSVDLGSDNDFLGAHAIFSDNGAKSWQVGAVDSEGQSTINPNETTVVELKDGRLYFNTRNHSFRDTIAHRAIAFSQDAGLTFESPFSHETQLMTPIVHASLTRNERALFFFAPHDEKDRKDLSMWRSEDEGESWVYDRLIYEGSAAYSSACLLSERTIGLLLEVDDYGKILFRTIPVK